MTQSVKSKNIYASIFLILLVIFCKIEWQSKCAFFIGNYYLYSLIFIIFFGSISLYIMYRKIEKFGLSSLLISILLIPLVSFYTLPRLVNYINFKDKKLVELEGLVKDKYYLRRADDPYMRMLIDDLSIGTITTTFSPSMYNKIKVNSKIKIRGELSSICFCYWDVVK